MNESGKVPMYIGTRTPKCPECDADVPDPTDASSSVRRGGYGVVTCPSCNAEVLIVWKSSVEFTTTRWTSSVEKAVQAAIADAKESR